MTAPRMSAGIASTGSASTTAKTSRLTAVSAVTVDAAGKPARMSMRYCSAAPTGPPPGAMFDSALLASCEAITGRHCRARSARRCRSHRHAFVATCSASITASDPIEKRVICRHDENTSMIFGNTK